MVSWPRRPLHKSWLPWKAHISQQVLIRLLPKSMSGLLWGGGIEANFASKFCSSLFCQYDRPSVMTFFIVVPSVTVTIFLGVCQLYDWI
jgi:hypothetical protein